VEACAAEMRIVDVNATAWQSLGAGAKAELLGSLQRVFVPESLPGFRELVLQLAEERPLLQTEGWNARLSGERRWVQLTGRVFPGHERDWSRVLISTVDVTDRRRAEEERSALQERLRQAEKLEAVGRLAGGVAHDFNNILSGILGYAELTSLELEPGSELHEHQQRIREAALRARDLVRQILAFSRRDRSSRRAVDVPALVHEALGLMRTGIPSSATLEVRIDPDAGATLADPTQLHQIVLNLCSNARDAIGTYGKIEVAVAPIDLDGQVAGLPAGPYVRIRVRDDGMGMDEATKGRLFEPFMTTKGPFGGHGLGLAVVHGIVTGAGGAIQVESAQGRGSTFDVFLPRHDFVDAPRPEPEPPARLAGRGERILLAEDEPMVRSAHKRLLESLGYVVEVAADGEEALGRFRANPQAYDLILTDQTMPRLSGLDLARAALAVRADVRVILCTGYSVVVDELEARRLGCLAMLAKPIDREALAEAVQKALGRG
jgi:two-component system, cell cycle sensor histidine kinase and response regulator CckA